MDVSSRFPNFNLFITNESIASKSNKIYFMKAVLCIQIIVIVPSTQIFEIPKSSSQ